MFYNILLVLSVVLASATSRADDNSSKHAIQEAPSTHSISFADPDKGFTLQYPEDWTRNEDNEGSDLFILAPKNPEGFSLANLSIISGNLPDGIDLETYSRENIKILLEDDPSIKIKESGKAHVGGVPSNWVRYAKEDEELEIIHYFFIKDQTAFLITAGASQDAFDRYQPSFEKIVKSFRFAGR